MATITAAARALLANHPEYQVGLTALPQEYFVDVTGGGANGLTILRPNYPNFDITPAQLLNAANVANVLEQLTHRQPIAGDRPQQSFLGWVRENIGAIVITFLVGAFLLWMTGAFSAGSVLTRLREQDFARERITSAITISTVLLGFILVINARFGQSDEDRFRGTEVFTGMVGVLGTSKILGILW